MSLVLCSLDVFVLFLTLFVVLSTSDWLPLLFIQHLVISWARIM